MESPHKDPEDSARRLQIADAVATRDRICLFRQSRCSSKDKEFGKMLVLSRKVGERIHVGENITVEIRRIAGNRVTLALDAPRNVRILRGELERAAREFEAPNELAANCAPANVNAVKETETQPPAYAVVSARVNVVRDLPTQSIGRDYAL